MLETKQLQCLLELNRHRHFGRAAQALGISQPALSKNLQRLEQTLDARLFDRSKHSVVPTAIGELVIRRGNECLLVLAEMVREVQLLQGKQIGQLQVGVGPAMSESFVTEAIARLAEKYPNARLRVRVDHWTQLAEWLQAGQLDLYVADVGKTRDDEKVRVIAMPSEPLVCFCRAGHPLARLSRVSRAELTRYPVAAPRMPEWARDWFAVGVAERNVASGNADFTTVECENYAMLKRMVMQSNCVSAALRSTIAAEVQAGQLVVLPVKAPLLKTQAGIVHLRRRTLSPLAEAFIQEVLAARNSG